MAYINLFQASVADSSTSPLTNARRQLISRLGIIAIICALVPALLTFIIFAGYLPIVPNREVVIIQLLINGMSVLVLLGFVVFETWELIKAWRAKVAGARLHLRIVGLFSVIAVGPGLILAFVASVTLERGLNPAFMQDMPDFINETAKAARLYRLSLCEALIREAELTASDLDRGRFLFDTNPSYFKDFFASRVHFLGFSNAAMMKRGGQIILQIDTNKNQELIIPEPQDFDDAAARESQCLVLKEDRGIVALRALSTFEDVFLYASRPLGQFAVHFPREAEKVIALYQQYDMIRKDILRTFAAIYLLLALIMLLSSILFGLSFANRLIAPIRRLIRATDQVTSGNLLVQVPIERSEGDLAHLGETFNAMTAELYLQHNRLMAANQLLDERRLFTEAVLSGVPAAVIGLTAAGVITVINPYGQKLLEDMTEAKDSPVGQLMGNVLPEVGKKFNEALGGPLRNFQSQITLQRGGRERLFHMRLTSQDSELIPQSYVITLDDVTDLVSAQRSSAWADVARRIAHEIKNPLTPIQLSAERLRRKYGQHIQSDQKVFDQCIDTIVRQVEDIKRMVDEFSSFARMPKANPERGDINQPLRQVLLLMRIAHPAIVFEESLPPHPVEALFDRRLLSQALTNVIKNATESINAQKDRLEGHIWIEIVPRQDGAIVIDITDNGKGFLQENRQRLLEPYMTTRAEGTGLGLAMVAKVLEEHGGTIELLDASPDLTPHGACVRIIFPSTFAFPDSPKTINL